MNSRKTRHKKKKSVIKNKFLIGTLLLSIGIGSSINVAFADQDIEAMLLNWFDKQKNQSIEKIESAIMSEKELQMQRLKEELQIEIAKAEKELNQFTDKEKKARQQELKKYTNQLIKDFDVDDKAEKERINAELNAIVEKARSEMDNINDSSTKASTASETLETPTAPEIETPDSNNLPIAGDNPDGNE